MPGNEEENKRDSAPTPTQTWIEWVKQRQTFGKPLSERQGVQWMIADSEIELRAARLLMYQAAWNADLGRDVRVDAAICKLTGTETAFRIVDRVDATLAGLRPFPVAVTGEFHRCSPNVHLGDLTNSSDLWRD